MLFACMDGIAPARVHECCLSPTAVGADAAEDMLGSSPSQDSAEPCSALGGTKLALTIVKRMKWVPFCAGNCYTCPSFKA